MRPLDPRGADLEVASEPIVGWRVWNLSEGADGPVLLPAGSGSGEWPRRRPLRARCSVARPFGRRRSRHEAPGPACLCGIHAAASLDVLTRERPAWPPAPVIGRVAIWGRTIAHERGWRAEWAYPDRLRLACVVCAWIEPGPGEPVAMHAFMGRLYAFCERHVGGLEIPGGRRTAAAAVDPLDLRARILDAYAVDLLPAEALVPVFSRPAAPETPAYVPAVRLVAHRGKADGDDPSA